MIRYSQSSPIAGPSSNMALAIGNNYHLGFPRKRTIEETSTESKRSRYDWCLKLETSINSQRSDDTESVCSAQGYETALVQDTPDTDTSSDYSSSEDHFDVEYDVADPSSDEDNPLAEEAGSSSGTDDIVAAAGAAIAAAICDNSLEVEAWLTDGEDSDDGSVGSAGLHHTDYWTCVQCKAQNNTPMYRYCSKCFQVRKNFFPPRPKGRRKKKTGGVQNSNTTSKQDPAGSVAWEKSKQALEIPSSSSLDSGLGSSQELPTTINLTTSVTTRGTKRKNSSSISESSDVSVKMKRYNKEDNGKKKEAEKRGQVDKVIASDELVKGSEELCIICNSRAKNSIFLHGRIGHMCCCYKCAMNTWTTNKRCPICNCKVKNVVKVFAF